MAEHDIIPEVTKEFIGEFNTVLNVLNLCYSCAYHELILSLIATGVSNGLIDPNHLDEEILKVVEAVPINSAAAAHATTH